MNWGGILDSEIFFFTPKMLSQIGRFIEIYSENLNFRSKMTLSRQKMTFLAESDSFVTENLSSRPKTSFSDQKWLIYNQKF